MNVPLSLEIFGWIYTTYLGNVGTFEALGHLPVETGKKN